MAAAGAAEVPAIAYLVVGLLMLLAWLAARGLLAAWSNSFGALFDWLGHHLNFHVGWFHVDLGKPFYAVDGLLRGWLSDAAAKTEHAAGYLFHGFAEIQLWIARETLAAASEAAMFGRWLVHVEIPGAIHAATHALHVASSTITHRVHSIETRVVHVTRIVRVAAVAAAGSVVPRIAIPYASEWHWIHRHWKGLTRAVAAAGAIAVPGTLPWLWDRHRIGAIEHALPRIYARLRRLEGVFTSVGAAAIVANALPRLGLRWLRCRNVGRIGSALCGLEPLLVDALVLGTLDAIAVADLCLFSDGLRLTAEAIRPELEAFVTVTDALVGCHGAAKPLPLGLPTASLPPVPAPLALGV